MTIESAIFDALKTLVSNRVYPDLNDAGTSAPYIVYQQVGGTPTTFLERASPSKSNARMQITSWTTTRAASKVLAKQVEAAMVALTTISAKPIGEMISLYDEVTKLRGTEQDFSVWSDR